MRHSDRRHLLLILRDARARDALSRGLREYDYAVFSAADGAAAQALLHAQPIDLVLCEDAEEQIASLAASLRGGPTLIALGAAQDSFGAACVAMQRALQLGAYDYLPSPHRPQDIALALAKAAARESLGGDEYAAATAARFLPAPDGQGKSSDAALPGLLAVSPAMQALLAKVRRVAVHRTTVLLTGESGTGKEVLARALHNLSPRREGPLVAVNCGALPETLLESLLFGHRRGAFTDAVRDQRGLLLDADRGTLFLDEIAELSPRLQVKLLRVLPGQSDAPYQLVQPLGAEANDAVQVDVRIVAATLRNLEAEVAAGRFRHDLYYRLSVVPLHVPPLRERKDDILPLAQLFLQRAAKKLGRPLAGFTAAAQAQLVQARWPGNVRQLENTIERAAVLADHASTILDAADLPPMMDGGSNGAWSLAEQVSQRPTGSPASGHAASPLGQAAVPLLAGEEDLSIKRAQAQLETQLIQRALVRTRGNRSAAARLLQLSHRALLYKLREYGLDPSAPDSSPPEGRRPAARRSRPAH